MAVFVLNWHIQFLRKTHLRKSVFISFLCCTIFCLLALVSHANTQSKTVVGRVLDKYTYKALQSVLVINKNTSLSTLTNDDGFFYLKASKDDTLLLYLVSHIPYLLTFESEEIFGKQAHLILLMPDVELLKEVEIIAQKQQREKYPFNTVPATAMNPMTFLYERFSSKYQQYAKLKEIIDKKEREEQLKRLKNQRFTKELVMAVTDIDAKDVDEFIQISNFSKSFLQEATDYELLVEIIRKYELWEDRR